MKYISILVILLSSCKQNKYSEIDVIKLDSNQLNEIIGNSIKTNVDTIRRHDFYYIEHYRNEADNKLTNVLKDSVGNVVGINQTKNGIRLFVAEYYPDGQIKGKLTIDTLGAYTGPATYYYEDGRIRSSGYLKNGEPAGEWKYYDKNGKPTKQDNLL